MMNDTQSVTPAVHPHLSEREADFMLSRRQRKLQSSYAKTWSGTLKWACLVVWLFTESNMATFVMPNACFGVFGAFSSFALTSTRYERTSCILLRIPMLVVFNWANVLVFDVANQRLPEHVLEDTINKPWRPLPRGLIECSQAQTLLLALVPLVFLLNHLLGVSWEGLSIFVLTWLYNDLHGGDELSRDIIISAAFALYNSASVKLVAPEGAQVTPLGRTWVGLVSAVVLTTMSIQDLKDMKGDKIRGRKTMPLAFGERFSRNWIATWITVWSFGITVFWGFKSIVTPLIMLAGAIVSYRVLHLSGEAEDAGTWRIWCLWTAMLYLAPVGGCSEY